MLPTIISDVVHVPGIVLVIALGILALTMVIAIIAVELYDPSIGAGSSNGRTRGSGPRNRSSSL